MNTPLQILGSEVFEQFQAMNIGMYNLESISKNYLIINLDLRFVFDFNSRSKVIINNDEFKTHIVVRKTDAMEKKIVLQLFLDGAEYELIGSIIK